MQPESSNKSASIETVGQDARSERRAYQRPRLTRLGSVRTLTLGSAGKTVDAGATLMSP